MATRRAERPVARVAGGVPEPTSVERSAPPGTIQTLTPALAISTRTVLERDGSVHRVELVMCPREERNVSVERCVSCVHCERLEPDDHHLRRPSVACAFQGAAGKPACTVGRALSRFSPCVRVDAVAQLQLAPPPAAWLPLVDERMHLVGVVRAGPRIRVEDGAGELAIEEHASVHDALAHMARKRTRHLPVVARDRTLVGVIEDLDAMQGLRALAAVGT